MRCEAIKTVYEYKLDINHAFNLAMGSHTVGEVGLFTGVLRSCDDYLCKDCRTGDMVYIWVARYKPVQVIREGKKLTVLCQEKKNEGIYYIFQLPKSGYGHINDISADVKSGL